MDMTEGKCIWLGILQLLPLPGRGKYAGCYLYGIQSGDTDASYGSPWAVAMAQMVSWFILSGLFLFSKDNGFFTKREMTIQLMGFYCNFVQIDNG